MNSLKIRNHILINNNTENKVFIIAEIGQNHQGSLSLAKQMILAAKNCGCDCVKFQKSHLPTKFTKTALCREYTGPNSWGSTYGEHKEFLEFTINEFRELKSFAESIDIIFCSSAMDQVSLEHLMELGLEVIKIGSGDANNFPLLNKVAKLSVPLIISTGMQTLETIKRIVNIMKCHNKENFALLHCISAYPTKPNDVRLQMIQLFQKEFPNIIIGYSGHEEGILLSQAAVLLGARIIERHFTLDKNQKGSDHCCSLNESELTELVNAIRILENSNIQNENRTIEYVKQKLNVENLNNYDRNCLEQALITVTNRIVFTCELDCRKKLGKSLCYSRDLFEGVVIQDDDLVVKVTEPFGISAENIDKFINKKLQMNVSRDDSVKMEHLC